MCSFGKKMIHRLHQRHEYLEAQAKRCEIVVEVEVGKVRVENEKKAMLFSDAFVSFWCLKCIAGH